LGLAPPVLRNKATLPQWLWQRPRTKGKGRQEDEEIDLYITAARRVLYITAARRVWHKYT
jgi:hypothetical protein